MSSGPNTASVAGAPAPTAGAQKLGLLALTAMVVGSMIGGGVYSLPQNMAQDASAGAIILAWLITGAGMLFLGSAFVQLSQARPDLTTGIYSYARDGFGRYAGFNMSLGYWLSSVFGNVGFAVLTMDSLNYFFPPYFAGGNTLLAVVSGSVIIWIMNFLVLNGVRSAAFLNTISTIAKIVPLAIFAMVLIWVFSPSHFFQDFWGHASGFAQTSAHGAPAAAGEQVVGKPLGTLMSQIKSTMLVTLWVFIGIEGAVVVSDRAKSQHDVAAATIIGFVFCLVLYAALSLLPFGLLSQPELAAIPNPSTAGVLQAAAGKWGSVLMNVGLLISVLSCWLAWTMLMAELPWASAKDHSFPRQFAKQNAHEANSVSLWVSSLIMQAAMILVYFSHDAWSLMLSITGVMVLPPYLACTLYLIKVGITGKMTGRLPYGRAFAVVSGVLGSIYALWLLYAAGLNYDLMGVIVFAASLPLFLWARAQQRAAHRAAGTAVAPVMTKPEAVAMAILLLAALAGIYFVFTGQLKLGL
ncbi:basic amino acid/polyamine antiporter [Ottowia sp.]|uniref:basic amino acid/polyamine antiporter n=1 Tax=Ottowia sp. TaxID=1898956 RepID=UPI00262ED341|nr:basic amino acid/polyamine antiporter [Ottowia sp.]